MKQNKLRLSTQIAIIVSIILFLSVTIGSLILINRMTQIYETELGNRVMAIGQSLAQFPTIRQAITINDGSNYIQPIAERVRLATDVDYVVIFDMDKKRFSHPLEDRIGTVFHGGDEGPSLAEHSYISKAKGVNGIAVRSFVPIIDEDGSKQVGVVVVGVMIPSFFQMVREYHFDLYLSLVLGTTFGITGAVWVSKKIKKQMFDMEPLDIAHMYEEREKVIESISEGIIAIDHNERITVLNRQAAQLLGVEQQDVIGRPIHEVIPDSPLREVLYEGKPQYHRIRQRNNKVMISNRVPIIVKGKIRGAMSTLQDRTEVYQLAEKLTGVNKYIDALRAQNHEYLNKLHTISGLIQLQRYDEVLEKILLFSEEKDAETGFLTNRIKDYSVSGLILGKISHAKELGVHLNVDHKSFLENLPSNIRDVDLLMIIGNLLENAIYATYVHSNKDKQVTLFIEGNDDGIEIEVIDNGIGMTNEELSKIFEYGYSSKGEQGQGIGLYLVKQLVELLRGEIFVNSLPSEGTHFTVVIPSEVINTESEPIETDTISYN